MICDICNENVPRRILEIHKRIVHSLFKKNRHKSTVNDCNREFSNKKVFQNHLSNHHLLNKSELSIADDKIVSKSEQLLENLNEYIYIFFKFS